MTDCHCNFLVCLPNSALTSPSGGVKWTYLTKDGMKKPDGTVRVQTRFIQHARLFRTKEEAVAAFEEKRDLYHAIRGYARQWCKWVDDFVRFIPVRISPSDFQCPSTEKHIDYHEERDWAQWGPAHTPGTKPGVKSAPERPPEPTPEPASPPPVVGDMPSEEELLRRAAPDEMPGSGKGGAAGGGDDDDGGWVF